VLSGDIKVVVERRAAVPSEAANGLPTHLRHVFTMNGAGTDLVVQEPGFVGMAKPAGRHPQRRKDSIQAGVIRRVFDYDAWDVVIDDDGAGEIAGVVALKIDDDGLLIHFSTANTREETRAHECPISTSCAGRRKRASAGDGRRPSRFSGTWNAERGTSSSEPASPRSKSVTSTAFTGSKNRPAS
jgi:hypothetical protein